MPLLAPGETATSGRIRLSPLPDAAQADTAWLEPALSPEWSLGDFEAARAESEGLLISDESGAAMGLALVRLDSPASSDATISFLAMQPERRFRGLGGEAGLAIERLMRARAGVKCVYAGVPEGRGLAVYFWLRLGFRPLSTAEAPKGAIGLTTAGVPGIWMVRDKA